MIAIAATEGRAYIYELKSMKQMRQEFEEDSIFAPVKEVSVLTSAFVYFPTLTVLL